MRVETHLYRRSLGELLHAGGVDPVQASTLAKNLTWCDMVGRCNHGIERLPILLERIKMGGIKSPCEMRIERLAAAVGRLDADSGFGHHAGEIGMSFACDTAAEAGIGVVGIKNSNFFGVGAYYANLAAQRGMIGVALSNSFPKVAAFGGTEPVLGTNPMALAAPRSNGRAVMIDMSTAALAGSSVRDAIASGQMLEPGLAIDRDGEPILDPSQVKSGTLLPAAGAKGFALALMVEILSGVLTQAGVADEVRSMYEQRGEPGGNGHFLLAIDVTRWMPIGQYYDRLDHLLAAIGACTTPARGNAGARIPGDARWAAFDESAKNGISIKPHTAEKIADLANRLGVDLGWS